MFEIIPGVWDEEDEMGDMGFGDSWFYNDGCCDHSGLLFGETGSDEADDQADDGEQMCTD